ncbi:unnamed protein product [Moneuplotes crassus]|uniref:Nuclear transcription factor Y subunit n=2 Tax=Euplotes crassus TaxID=5936 RepID=A0AAD1X6F5_EUPCR|nr:unnamed protein product [Moneuplotes crassus]
MSEFNKEGSTPLMFTNQSPMLDNLHMSGGMFKQSPLTLNMLSQLMNISSPPMLENLGDDSAKKLSPDKKKMVKFTPKAFSPVMESPTPLNMLSSSLMANIGSGLGQGNVGNSAFLTASKFAQDSFRTPAFNKAPSLLIPKVTPKAESVNSASKISNTAKEEVYKSETSSNTKLLNDFKSRKFSHKDEKIPLPSVFGDGIIYVSAKRYKRILIRRKKRKAEKRLVPKPKTKTKREPMHQSRSKLAKRRIRDENGRYIPIKTDEDKKNKVKCTRGRKSRKYYELMERFENEGNTEMIEKLKVHGTKGLDLSKYE